MVENVEQFIEDNYADMFDNPRYLGGGASSNVVSAILKKDLEQVAKGITVAVKVPRGTEPTLIERFEREIDNHKAINDNTNPNMVKFYGSQDRSGIPVIFLEKANQSLRQWRKSRADIDPVTVDRAIERAAYALEAIHNTPKNGKSIVHRDVKPTNFGCFGPDPKDLGLVKLLDFGSIGELYRDDKDIGRVGSSYVTAGTLEFSDPHEIAESEGDKVLYSVQGDIYSLALVYVFLTSGDTPFSETRLRQHMGGKMARSFTVKKIKTGKGKCKTYIEDSLSELIGDRKDNSRFDLILACLDPNPANRPKNVKEFLDTYYQKDKAPLAGLVSEVQRYAAQVKKNNFPSLVAIDVFMASYQRLHESARNRGITQSPELRSADATYQQMVQWFEANGRNVLDRIPDCSVEIGDRTYEKKVLPIMAAYHMIRNGKDPAANYFDGGRSNQNYDNLVARIRKSDEDHVRKLRHANKPKKKDDRGPDYIMPPRGGK